MQNPVNTPPIGYKFTPHSCYPQLGYEALHVYVYDQPTGEHFDPRRVFCTVAEEHRGRFNLRKLHIEHPWNDKETYRLCAGRIILEDHKEKRVEAFAWGGEVRIQKKGAFTPCTFRTPVPMLVFDPNDLTEDTLISEFEALLARRRAAWEPRVEEFEHRLAEADPEALFAAAVLALHTQLQTYPSTGRSAAYWKMRSWAEDALERLGEHGWGAGQIPALEEIL